MIDITGKKLEIGQAVVYNPPIYKGIVVGRIVAFTPKGVRVTIQRVGKQTVGSYFTADINKTTTVVFPGHVAIVNL
jgi:hypothetical protein